MLDFVLAVALICPTANTVAVQEILTTKPVSYVECDKATRDEKLRKEHLKERANKKDCELDLICVRVYWSE